MTPLDQAQKIINTHNICLYTVKECVAVMDKLVSEIAVLRTQVQILKEAQSREPI